MGAVDEAVTADVVIVGAGISGVDAAYRLAEGCPGTSYLVLEARGRMGGTWDTFRYPGVRSDSDIHSFSYPFRTWDGDGILADGPSIRRYVEATAAEAGIDEHIRFGVRVRRAVWDSAGRFWTLTATGPDGEELTYRCRFVLGATGYYDHDHGYLPDFPGRSEFAGRFVHPQHWPDDLDHAGRRVVVIGSGATAATVVPAMAEDAAHVTMLQRSPSYMAAVPDEDPFGDLARRFLSARVAHRVIRAKNIVAAEASYRFARLCPRAFSRTLRGLLAQDLPDEVLDAHFTPTYRPWDQRVCRIPAGDLSKAIASGRASVVTDEIDTFVPEGIRLVSGKVLEADVVVAATGLNLLAFGGIDLVVDAQRVDPGERLAYRGLALEGVPNFVFAVGYTNASWTLRADLVARYAVRLIRYMRSHGYASARPRAAGVDERRERRPLIGLRAGYVLRAADRLPKLGTRPPWVSRQSYLAESLTIGRADVRTGMEFA